MAPTCGTVRGAAAQDGLRVVVVSRADVEDEVERSPAEEDLQHLPERVHEALLHHQRAEERHGLKHAHAGQHQLLAGRTQHR